MINNLKRHKEELDRLIALGDEMELAFYAQVEGTKLSKEQVAKVTKGLFERQYQRWFTEASAVVRQLIPERSKEFDNYYYSDPRRKEVTLLNYCIQDWVTGMRSNRKATNEKHFNDEALVGTKFKAQQEILASASLRFESSLLDIRQIAHADLFDSELAMSRELLSRGFVRPAGVIAGVVLERHLGSVCATHDVRVPKQNPTISDLNDTLKAHDIVEIPMWRFVQRLGDLRNLAAHSKEREPTKDEVLELIDGTDRVSKTVF